MTPTPHPRRGVPLVAVIGVVLALVVAAVWLAGGLEKATNRLILLPAGTRVDMGPMEMSVTAARVKAAFVDGWELSVSGRCRNLGDKAVDATADRLAANAFAVQDPQTKTVYGDAALTFGEGGSSTGSNALNPGLPEGPCQLRFNLPAAYQPSTSIMVGISQVEFIDVSVTANGNLAWSATRLGYRFEVPLTRITDEGP